ncbi:MAG: hypothetical protein HY850_10345 [Betaproteobacteria bacterium]|nr:hypothetical protein [Betaproteobacteria bacterium]
MDEELIEIDIAAQLALHAILLEQLFSTTMLGTSNPAEKWRAMGEDIIRACQFTAAAPDDMSEQLIVQERVCHHAKIFCERVMKRVENP